MDAQFLTYSALDSACTLECRNGFWDDLANGFEPAYHMTIDLFPVLMFMQTRGIRVDLTAMETVKVDIQRTAAEKQEELNRLCGRELNVNSPKDCQSYFYVELGIAPYYNKEGRVTVDDTALQRMVRGTAKRPSLRQAKLVQDIRGLQKLYSTYLDIEFDADSRMRCSYNPRGTKFGRLSSSATIFGTGTNMQNLPQEFKKFLLADDGYVLWEIDKRQAEWVVMAYLSNDANMIQTVEDGSDSHVHTAHLMFGVEKEIIEWENKVVGNSSDSDYIARVRGEDPILARYTANFPRTMSARQCGKKSNHGLNYDEGPNTFALLNEIEIPESKRVIALYHQIYPGIRSNYYPMVQRSLQKDRSLTNCFGRKVRFMDAWGHDLWKAGYSMLPQSTVVDSLNKGMVATYHDSWVTRELNVDLLAQVHDSVLMQVPVEVVLSPEFAKLQQLVYNNVSPEITYNAKTFKIATDMKLGLNWGGFHKENNPLGMREVKSLTDIPKVMEALNVQRAS